MVIGIFSDSHDNIFRIREAVELFNSWSCQLVIHAGDYIAPFAIREMRKIACPVRGVFGNNDGERQGLSQMFKLIGEIKDPPFSLEALKTRILILHDPAFAGSLAKSGDYDLVVCGHTHHPEIRREGSCLIVNPGECGGWLTGKATVAKFDPESGQAEVIELTGG